MVQNGIFWTIGEQTYIFYYPIISYKNICLFPNSPNIPFRTITSPNKTEDVIYCYTYTEDLVLLKAHILIAGFYHLINTPHTSDRLFWNGAILVEYKTIQNVV